MGKGFLLAFSTLVLSAVACSPAPPAPRQQADSAQTAVTDAVQQTGCSAPASPPPLTFSQPIYVKALSTLCPTRADLEADQQGAPNACIMIHEKDRAWRLSNSEVAGDSARVRVESRFGDFPAGDYWVAGADLTNNADETACHSID